MKHKLIWVFEEFGSSVLLLLLGAALFLWPAPAGSLLCYGLGIALLAGGGLRLWSYARQRRQTAAFLVPWDLAVGAALLAVGLFFLLQPQVVLSILPVMMGLLLLFTAVPKAAQAFRLRRYRWDRWWIPLAWAAALALFGGVLLFRPFQAAEVLLRLVGLALIAGSLLDLWLGLLVHRLEQGPDGGMTP